MSGPYNYYNHFHNNPNPNRVGFWEHDVGSGAGKWVDLGNETKKEITLSDAPGWKKTSSFLIPPHYTAKMWDWWLHATGKYGDDRGESPNGDYMVPCGKWDDNGLRRIHTYDWSDRLNHVRMERCDDWDTFKFKCCTNSDPKRYAPSNPPGGGICGPFYTTRDGMSEKCTSNYFIDDYCKTHPNNPICKDRVDKIYQAKCCFGENKDPTRCTKNACDDANVIAFCEQNKTHKKCKCIYPTDLPQKMIDLRLAPCYSGECVEFGHKLDWMKQRAADCPGYVDCSQYFQAQAGGNITANPYLSQKCGNIGAGEDPSKVPAAPIAESIFDNKVMWIVIAVTVVTVIILLLGGGLLLAL